MIIFILFIISLVFYDYSYFFYLYTEEVDLPFPAYHLWKINSSFTIIDKLYFERDYVFDLKIEIGNPRNGTIEIEKWALGERYRNNANLRWRKPHKKGQFYYLYGILPKREIFLRLKIKTNNISGVGVGYLSFVHLYKKYYFKITLATLKDFYLSEPLNENLIPYIAGYNFEYGNCTEMLKKKGGIHPFDPLIRKYASIYKKPTQEKTAESLMHFVMGIFEKGINVTYVGDYPDYYYLERFEKFGAMWGVCSERSIVLVSLLRYLGIPAKIVYGVGFPVSHAFVEAYINGEWINLDPSYNIIKKRSFYYERVVRELSTLQSFFGGVMGNFIKNVNHQFVRYPYQENLNHRYLKDSITITGISGVQIGKSYYLSIKVRWATTVDNPKIKFVFQDAVNKESVVVITTKSLLFRFSEASMSIKFKIDDFVKYKDNRYIKIKIYLIKEKLLDFIETPPITLKTFSF